MSHKNALDSLFLGAVIHKEGVVIAQEEDKRSEEKEKILNGKTDEAKNNGAPLLPMQGCETIL